MRTFAIGSMIVVFAALAGTVAADDQYSVPKSADPARGLNQALSGGKPKCTFDDRSYAVGMSACIDQSFAKCSQIVNPKNPNDVTIGWVDQHQKCNP